MRSRHPMMSASTTLCYVSKFFHSIKIATKGFWNSIRWVCQKIHISRKAVKHGVRSYFSNALISTLNQTRSQDLILSVKKFRHLTARVSDQIYQIDFRLVLLLIKGNTEATAQEVWSLVTRFISLITEISKKKRKKSNLSHFLKDV